MAFLPSISLVCLRRFSVRFSQPLKYSPRYIPQSRCATFGAQSEHLKKLEDKCGGDPAHFKSSSNSQASKTAEHLDDRVQERNDDLGHRLPHPIWTEREATDVNVTHEKPKGACDWSAYLTVMTLRKGFDLFSGYTVKTYTKTLDERDMLRRCIFLETVAGVPGFAAAMVRHLQSLRRMRRDNGWIHTLLEEAENERMHLMTFLQLRRPGPIFRAAVVSTQIVFTGMFSLAYFISPHFCHRLVGYLEEQAVITYTDILEEIDSGRLPMWSKLPAPKLAINYWKLPPNAMMRDVILVVRADEAHHRLVNHTLGSLDLKKKNPFRPGE